MKTKVYFYMEPNEIRFTEIKETVLAVFPEEPYKNDFDATITCYAHVGQHLWLLPRIPKGL